MSVSSSPTDFERALAFDDGPADMEDEPVVDDDNKDVIELI